MSDFANSLILPFAIMWRELDWNLRWYQVSLLIFGLEGLLTVASAIRCASERECRSRGESPVRLRTSSSTSEMTCVDAGPDLVGVCPTVVISCV